jgi:hypothetical protein
MEGCIACYIAARELRGTVDPEGMPMFERSCSDSHHRPSAPLAGRLPAFTPQRVARALHRDGEPRREQPVKPPPAPSSGGSAVTIDVAAVLRGALDLAAYLGRRAAQKKAAEQELEARALELACAYQGLLGVPDLLMRTECTRARAQACLCRLESSGVCRFLCTYREEALYVFPAFLPRAWSCEYCLSSYQVRPDMRSLDSCACPGCGAAMSQRILV